MFRCDSGRRLEGEWAGVPLEELVAVADLSATTTHLLVESALDYTACIALTDAMDALLAFEEDRVDRAVSADATPRLVGSSIDAPRMVKRVTRITGLSLRAGEDPSIYEYLPN